MRPDIVSVSRRVAYSLFVAATSLLLALATPALANPVVSLTYDNPVIQITPGQSFLVTATLSVSPSASGPFVTNAAAEPTAGPPVTYIGGLGFYQEQYIISFPESPGFLFEHDSTFSPSSSTSLANLDVPAGSSIDLVLGSIQTDSTLPLGTYITDIGINQACAVNNCLVNEFAAPNYLDPGNLTIDVVPEPSTLSIFAVGTLALLLLRRRMGKYQSPLG